MIRKLTPAELAANPEYVRFLRSLDVGEGGMASVAEEGVGRLWLKGKLNAAAEAAGVRIRFHRSGADTVVFEVIARDAS